jgi:hypothetical protein
VDGSLNSLPSLLLTNASSLLLTIPSYRLTSPARIYGWGVNTIMYCRMRQIVTWVWGRLSPASRKYYVVHMPWTAINACRPVGIPVSSSE